MAGKKNKAREERTKEMIYEKEYNVWRDKMNNLIRSEPTPPAMEVVAKKHWTRTKTSRGRGKTRAKKVELYDQNTDFKKLIHEHWDEKYGGGISRHQHSS